MRIHPSSIAVFFAACLGFVFSSVSAFDSVAHLDRQVHGIHCSYLLGLGETDGAGTSGCYATLMSGYSSILRKSIWGGIPVALPGMAVFGYIAFAVLWLVFKQRDRDVRSIAFLNAACLLPTLTSIFMWYVSVTELDTVCKLCAGIYFASFASLGGSIWMFMSARKRASENLPTLPTTAFAKAFLAGVIFVFLPVLTYAAIVPDFSKYIGNCGTLIEPSDPNGALIPIGLQNRASEMVEVLDPLCAACGLFEKRFKEMPERELVRRKILLFPLDKQCNWMLAESVHPGACAVSEAIICAGSAAPEVMDFAFSSREIIMEETRKDPTAAARIMKEKFPSLSQCIGSASTKAKLNQALRWTVKNQLQLLTPQIYVDGYRLCDEDTDLGLEYALSRLISKNYSPVPVSSAKSLPETKKTPSSLPQQKAAVPRKKTPSISEPVSTTKETATTPDKQIDTTLPDKASLDSSDNNESNAVANPVETPASVSTKQEAEQ